MAIAPYTSWLGHGTVCPTPPVTFTNVHAFAFGIDASRDAIQSLVDKLLMPATDGLVEYHCPVGAALVTFIDAERCASTVDAIGWMPGRESAVWVLLIEKREDKILGLRPVLWSPYIFIDTDLGMVPGREIWGWPKSMAHVSVASDAPAEPARFAVKTNIFRTFDPNLRGQAAELISVTGTRPLELGDPTWEQGGDVFRALTAEFLSGIGAIATELLELLGIEPVLPAMALKQFRDSINPAEVCFRALVNAPCRFTQFRSGHLLTDDYTLEIETCASHAIARDLLGSEPQSASTQLPVRWAIALDFDFIAENGSTIVP